MADISHINRHIENDNSIKNCFVIKMVACVNYSLNIIYRPKLHNVVCWRDLFGCISRYCRP